VRVPLGLFTGWITLATPAATTEVLLAEGVEDPWPGADAWGVAVLGVAGGIAAAVTRRIPVSGSYPAVVVWGLTTTAVRTLPRWRAAGLAALAGAAGVLLPAVGSRRRAVSHPAP
jgi:hypothetical protein